MIGKLRAMKMRENPDAVLDSALTGDREAIEALARRLVGP
jgi:hypothetical protein